MMEIRKLIENRLFKVRHIYKYKLTEYPYDANVKHISMTDPSIHNIIKISRPDLLSYVHKRINNPNWILFYYIHNNTILGYSFLHITENEEWNDALPTKHGEARLGSNFVYPEYRGRRIRGSICKQQINYAYEANLKLWSVIERSNTASIAAESPYSQICSRNYLIKLLGKNIITIISKPLQMHILLGDKNERR